MTAASVARSKRRRPGFVTLSVHQAASDVVQFFRNPMAAVFTFSLPVIMLVLFGAVFHHEIGDTGVDFQQYFIAGVIAAGLVSTSFANLAFGLAFERSVGTLKRMASTPMSPAVFFAGKTGLTLITGLCQMSLMLAIGALFLGLDLPTDPHRLLVLAYVFVVGNAACALIGIAYSRIIKDPNNAAAMVMLPFLVLQIISGVFLVVSDLARPLQLVANVFPLRWMASMLRYVFLPESFGAVEPGGSWNLATGAIILAAWVIGGLVACLTTFKWHFDE